MIDRIIHAVDQVLIPIIVLCLMGIAFYWLHRLDQQWNAEVYRRNMAVWYTCILPDGSTVRANYVAVYHRGSSWTLSTGKQIMTGTGNLTCKADAPNRVD